MTPARIGNPERVVVFDTTLRDGEQAPGFAMTPDGKVRVARALADLGVDVIEAGFAAASPADLEGVRRVARDLARRPDGGPTICALARCTPGDIEAAARALEPASRRRIHVFLATSDRHLAAKLRIDRAEALRRIASGVARAKRYTDDVEFSPEDASRTDRAFLAEAVAVALDAGATTINLPDTVGCATPDGIARMVSGVFTDVRAARDAVISVHCHDDLGLATANSLAAIGAGARQVECTVGGIGERAGNAAVEEVAMALVMHEAEYRAATGLRTRYIAAASDAVADATGIRPAPNKAIVGRNAFAHESGIHQHGMLADRQTYEAVRAEDVGRTPADLVLGRHSGKHAVLARLEALGRPVADDHVTALFARFKELTSTGARIDDAALGSLADEFAAPAPAIHTIEGTAR